MHNNPEKKEKYFRDLNEDLDRENKIYEERIEALLQEVEDEKNKKVRIMKANDKLNQFKNKVIEGLEKEEKKKKIDKIKKGYHENLKKFIDKKLDSHQAQEDH